MRWLLPLAGCIVSVMSLVACGADSGDSAETMRIEAQQPVLVSKEPLGDVVSGDLDAGDVATAVCFVAAARTNTGAAGTAIKLKSGRLSGYAAVTTLQAEAGERTNIFDVTPGDLRDGLSLCSA